jgi:dimethylhistidine N-methyltransferase
MNLRTSESKVRLMDLRPDPGKFREDFCQGLRRRPRQIAPKYFYDEAGSRLFERICETEEYFPARVEHELLRRHLDEICRLMGQHVRLVEFGSGNSQKTRWLLNHLPALNAYVPIDISRQHLAANAELLAGAYPEVEILPVCADYTEEIVLPSSPRPAARTVFFFPGSTIGNMTRPEAVDFLRRLGRESAPGDGLLIGIALQAEPKLLERAYNDSTGVTAAFNLNLLQRARRELGAQVDPGQFFHQAIYDPRHARIEMRLVSRRAQVMQVGGESFSIDKGDYLITEFSHKFTNRSFARLGQEAGFQPLRAWNDPQRRMAIHYFACTNNH